MKKRPAVDNGRFARALADAVLAAATPEDRIARMRRVRELGESPSQQQVMRLIAEFSIGKVQPLKMPRKVIISEHLEKRLAEEAAAKAQAEEAKLLAAPLKLRKAEEKRERKALKMHENRVKMELAKG